MRPKVSVLVTFYNQEEYVDDSLSSVLNQKTKFDFEVIIGEDGSSDATRDKIKKWMSDYPDKIQLFVMDREEGKKYIPGFRASQNRLNILKYVNGEYFIFLDGDDFFSDDDKLQKQVEILESPDNQDCIACAHNTEMLYKDGKKETITDESISEGKIISKDYWNSMYFHTDSLLIRSKVIESIYVDLLENNFNDNLITYSVIQQGSVYYLPQTMAIYRQTGEGIWTSKNAVVNSVRNMFLYDLANLINPDMKKETEHRMRVVWYDIYRLRKQIKAADLEEYSKEAEDKQLIVSYKWIHYNDLPLYEKTMLNMIALKKSWKNILRDTLRKIS